MAVSRRPAVPTTHAEWLAAYGATPERDAEFLTLSGEEVKPLYTADDVTDDPARDIGVPGGFPFTRGVYPSMYRGRLWTFRQFAGFGTAEETNERFHYLLDHGQTGLSTAFDMPSLMGHDSDHPMSLGEVGREGVAVDTLDDMQDLFAGIDLGDVSVSMTINAPAAIMMAFYVVAAERQGVPADRLGGTIQADILKEYIAQKEWCFPIDPAMRLMGDMVQWCSEHMPRWHPVSISGYHIREAGATAQQELAFTLKNGLTYVQQAVDRGLDVDDFAPRLSFFFNAQIDFFEEIAKYRAARRIWARELRDTFGAENPRSWLMRFHTQTAGVSLTAQQPLNNVTRTAIEALAGVLGGTQSLHTNSYDEALALPTEDAVRIALRTQQIIAHETGVANTIDPLGGSYFVEALTDAMEAAARDYFRRVDELGGMVEAVKQSFCQREIADASYELQNRIDAGDRIVVGVNRHTEGDDGQTEILRIDPALERKQIGRVAAVRARRDGARVEAALAALKDAAARDSENLMPHLVDAARVHATEGEIIHALQAVFGSYTETPVF
ncbi:MAG TPA: methylmalonyl-CoA mutase family protein [Baekduia sp.]|uniref:acyl-CoA mutase large subunit family protein n=1 Tax=Baekduia sp. TaxID=2600305 RepID=UPI002D76B13D|nr:methylmalonyl-CoA mutase family protein [Baekduia sp.]HET6506668.1 methylmalonyl-CoA mutase family protein [Baekduia sp.]